MARKEIGVPLNRENRNNHNENYTELFGALNKSAEDSEEAKRIAQEALDMVGEGKGYLEENKGVDYPLRNMRFNGNTGTVSEAAKNAILDAKVFGARIGYYYKLTMIANGYESNGKKRWGITLEERSIENFETTGGTNRFIFIYNNDSTAGNDDNANYQKGNDGIDTITVDNGEIACSVTIDRNVISNIGQGLFLNLATPHAPTAIIDPSNYFF